MRFVRFIVFVLVAICLIWLAVFLLARVFSGGSAPSTVVNDTKLPSYQDSTAELLIDGPVTVNQDHVVLRIAVNQNEVRAQKIKGYNGEISDEKTYASNPNAYAVFLRALEQVGFATGDTSSANRDERGKCPQNNRYIISMKNNDGQLFRYWRTSCGEGTFGGDITQTLNLFQNQVPEDDFNQLTQDIAYSL